MRQHHNCLYITTPHTWLGKQDQAVEVKRKDQPKVRVPLHHLESIVCFGPVSISPYLMATCAQAGISITYLTENGRFQARVIGPGKGNVLLRREHFRFTERPASCLVLARGFVFGKIYNARMLLLRAAREAGSGEERPSMEASIARLKQTNESLDRATDLEMLRGMEGTAARAYFDMFPQLLGGNSLFAWKGRNMRPPLDPANAVLSFVYTLLANDCDSALQAVGLDPQMGVLHCDRPGRPALALDLMEEFRALFADRLLFAMVNRGQLGQKHFRFEESRAVLLNEKGRKLVLVEYQRRKRRELKHPFLEEKTSFGFLPLLQARLLARFLRGDLDAYPPFLGS